jgi:hypothetical protein
VWKVEATRPPANQGVFVMKRVAPRLVLALVCVAFCLAVGELVLRSAGASSRATDRRGLHEPRPDRDWLYGMRPNAEGRLEVSGDITYRINADGFRDLPRAHPKPDGVFRIVVLGDSVAFGYGVEMRDTFSTQMESRLGTIARDDAAPEIEVLNLGVSGYNPYTEAALMRDLGERFEPDLVIVQFCINDLNDPTLHFDVQTRLHLGAIPDAAYPDPSLRRVAPAPPGPLLRACRHSKVCSLIDRLLLAGAAVEPTQVEQEAAAIPHATGKGKEWLWLSDLYAELDQISAQLGAPFAVLAFPFPAQLEETGDDPVQQQLIDLGRRGGWLTIDPLTSFRRTYAEGTALFIDWWHPTAVGHAIAARETLRALACAGLLPPHTRGLCSDPASDAARVNVRPRQR